MDQRGDEQGSVAWLEKEGEEMMLAKSDARGGAVSEPQTSRNPVL